MDKVLGLIGLAKKAGRITAGSELCEDAIRRGDSKLIIIADDISDNGKKAICDCCRHYGIKYLTYASKADLGTAVGSEIRAVISINDEGFARAIEDKITAISEERKG
ncbi:MAG: ribosomal L7Ae/L30e/S12e/Gadd45 family protein [Eubacteriales bacterium]|nr:ribosomal L7Ae/L30e/S12e/Gadd45 family protein [Eubacteriales bacterium]